MKLSMLILAVIVGGLLVSHSSRQQPLNFMSAGSGAGAPQGPPEAQQNSTAPSLTNPLAVTPRGQEGYRTCWAACAEMTMEFLGGGRIRQCEQASVAFNMPACCVREGVLEAASHCDQPWHPEFRKWGFDFDHAPSEFHPMNHLTWGEVTTEIKGGRPFLFGWVETPPITHMLVAIGYDEDINKEQMVIYRDPLADPTEEPIMTTYSKYSGSGDYAHKFDYFRIRPAEFE